MPEALILPLLATLGCLLGGWLCCRRSPDALEQASLLPFADDPPAAARMSEATGQHCKHLLQPLEEPSPETPQEHLLA